MMEEVDSPMSAVSTGSMPSSSFQTSNIRKIGTIAGKNSIYGPPFQSVSHDDIERRNQTGVVHDDDAADTQNETDMHIRGSKRRNSSTALQVHNDTSSIAVQESGFGRLSSIRRYITRCSLTRPKAFGAFLVTITCVLPLLLTVLILGTTLNGKLHNSKHLGKLSSSGLSSSAGDVAAEWASFSVTSTIAAAATDDSRCSAIAKGILVMGGNAVDAAVAAALCLGVVSPASSGIGGGCYILTHNSSTLRNEFIDSREYAPSGSTPDMFEKDPIKAQDGGLAIAVLSELRGLHLAWQRHGVLSWSAVVSPSALLAAEWVIDREVSYLLLEVQSQLYSGLYPELSALYLRGDGSMKSVGDTVQQPALSRTLYKIAEFGPDYLYVTMAATLASEIQAAGGIVSTEDIQSYVPEMHEPISSDFMGHIYIGVGGSSSGGLAVAGILKYMGDYPDPIASQGDIYYHRLVEAYNHVFAIRLSLGDPAFVNTTGPSEALLSTAYMSSLRAMTTDHSLLPIAKYGGKYHSNVTLKTDHGTTHLSVLDKWGNAVAITSTVNTYFGSKVISPSTGILFNNQMDDFSIPGAPNFFGLAPSPLNFPQAFKRPLSSMSPSFVLTNSGAIRLIGGGSGGPKIITATAQTILNSIAFGMDILSAVRAPRIHSQLLPPIVHIEDHILLNGLQIIADSSVFNLLTKIGHNVTSDGVVGYTQFISVDPLSGAIQAVSDPRKDGKPFGL